MILNCWEFKKCGREIDGINSKELGICPAAICKKANGINHGVNGGRMCWVVAGTLCGGEVQGTFAQKMINCKGCDFYKWVKGEESPNFMGMLTPQTLIDEITK